MWKYVHLALELSLEEHGHISGCSSCLKLFKVCMSAESANDIDSTEHRSDERESA
jgi:hypothetical protein